MSLAARQVWHVVPANGGGVDRFVRDLCRLRPGDGIVHVTDGQHVLEWPAEEDFLALDAACLPDLAFGGALGRPAVVHAHSADAPARQFCQTLCAATGAPYVLTLHDIGFAEPTATPFERAQRLRFARQAAARTAPSRYIARLAEAALQGAPCHLVENGVDAWPAQTALASAPARPEAQPSGPFAIAVIGAIGEHKGLQALLQLAAHLPPSLQLVIIGYTAQQLLPGWVQAGRVWMHGAFQPEDLPGLVRRYGVQWALFPPGMPESYSYALSDAWQAGLPAMVPDHGALAERLRRHGGGRIYPVETSPPALAALIAQWLSEAAVQAPSAASGAFAPVQAMVDSMTAIYEQAGDGAAAQAPDRSALASLAQQQLDTRFFRKELLHLQSRLESLAQQNEVSTARVQQLEAAHGRAQAEVDRLREQFAAAQHALGEMQARLAELNAGHAALATEHAALQERHRALQGRHDTLEQRHRRLTQRLSAPLRWLPAAWRERLIGLGRRWLI